MPVLCFAFDKISRALTPPPPPPIPEGPPAWANIPRAPSANSNRCCLSLEIFQFYFLNIQKGINDEIAYHFKKVSLLKVT